MNPSDEELKRIEAELQRVLGEAAGAKELPPAGGPLSGSMPELLRLLESLPDGAGAEALVRALSSGGRQTMFGQRGAQN